jgi:hypothetical protein
MSANGYKIKVNHEAESREAQELFFELGYGWRGHIEVKYTDARYIYTYYENNDMSNSNDTDYFNKHLNKEITLEELRNLVAEKKNGLISGSDALRALANGEELQQFINDEWIDLRRDISWRSILGDNYIIRIKPSTITINGIEVPAPFEPKDGELCWFISSYTLEGYEGIHFGGDYTDFIVNGVWSTEAEIKQVVAALRSVFTCN